MDEQQVNEHLLQLARAAVQVAGIKYGDVTIKVRDGKPYMVEIRQTTMLDDKLKGA